MTHLVRTRSDRPRCVQTTTGGSFPQRSARRRRFVALGEDPGGRFRNARRVADASSPAARTRAVVSATLGSASTLRRPQRGPGRPFLQRSARRRRFVARHDRLRHGLVAAQPERDPAAAVSATLSSASTIRRPPRSFTARSRRRAARARSRGGRFRKTQLGVDDSSSATTVYGTVSSPRNPSETPRRPFPPRFSSSPAQPERGSGTRVAGGDPPPAARGRRPGAVRSRRRQRGPLLRGEKPPSAAGTLSTSPVIRRPGPELGPSPSRTPRKARRPRPARPSAPTGWRPPPSRTTGRGCSAPC